MPILFKDLDWVSIGAGLIRAKLVGPDGETWRVFVETHTAHQPLKFLLREDNPIGILHEYDDPLALMCAIHHHNLTPVGKPCVSEQRSDSVSTPSLPARSRSSPQITWLRNALSGKKTGS